MKVWADEELRAPPHGTNDQPHCSPAVLLLGASLLVAGEFTVSAPLPWLSLASGLIWTFLTAGLRAKLSGCL